MMVSACANTASEQALAPSATGLRSTKMAKKPKGWNKFNARAKRIVAVPKTKVDEAIAQKREPTDNPPKK